MKRFIQTYKVSRVAMIIVRHDSDAQVFAVLRWAAADDAPTVLQRFPYLPKGYPLVRNEDVRMSDAQTAAVTYAAEQFDKEREQRRRDQATLTGVHSNG